MTMTCKTCGGTCEWQGRLSDLTHTKCLQCGAIDNQVPEEQPAEEPESEGGLTD